MNITILGGAGFIGSKLSKFLLDDNHKVHIIDSFRRGTQPILPLLDYPNLTCKKQDIRDSNLKLDNADVIVILAAIVGYPSCDKNPDLAKEINVLGTKNIIKKAKGKKIIFASTGSVYGELNQICDENTPVNPISLYSKTKLEGEKLVANEGGISLRPATAFGVSYRFRTDLLINDFIKTIVKEKKLTLYESQFKRTFLSVNDLAKGFKFAIDNYEIMQNNVWNLGDERLNLTKLEIAKKIQNKINYKLELSNLKHDKDVRNYFVDYSKIKNIGFSALDTIEDSIDKLITLYECEI